MVRAVCRAVPRPLRSTSLLLPTGWGTSSGAPACTTRRWSRHYFGGRCRCRSVSPSIAYAVATNRDENRMPEDGTVTCAGAAAELHRLINGLQISQAIHVAAVLG